jgi:hypothetical protein
MKEHIADSRPMSVIDWFVVALVVMAIALPFLIASVGTAARATWMSAGNALAILGCVLLLSWMAVADGAHSRVWRWLPPFWPWGKHVTAPAGRWIIVVLVILGTLLGVFSTP